MKVFTQKLKWPDLFRLSVALLFACNLPVLYANTTDADGIDQQKLTIRGAITEKGAPMPGVNVMVKGSDSGTIADLDGNYLIEVPDENSILVFSFIGYQTHEVRVGANRTVNVELQEDAFAMDEVIVVGYGIQTKRNVSGALSSITSDDITRTTSTSVSGALAGKVQGITTRAKDSRPGGGTNLQIRNMGDPLYVIDGVPYGGETGRDGFGLNRASGEEIFNQLTMEDIESITVLKDASAAIYGLRASNGVVLVTTKKGRKEEKVDINVNAYYGFQNLTRYPQPANAYQFVRAQLESDQNSGVAPRYSKEYLENYRTGADGYKSYNYYDIVRRKNVPQYNVNASASGGTKNSNYYLSVAHTGHDAIIKDFNYSRTNIQANIDAGLAKGLTVGTQISAVLEDINNAGVPGLDDYFNPLLSVFAMWPTESPYANDNPKYVHYTHNVNVNPATYAKDITGWMENEKKRMNVNIYAKYDFDFGLSAKGTYSYNYTNEDFDGMEYTYDAYRYDEETDTYFTQEGWGNQNPWREKHKRNVVARFAQFQLNYQKQLNDHYIAAVLAYERSDYDNEYLAIHTVPSNNYVEQMSFSEQDYLGDEWRYQAREGYIGRINYNYQSKYLIELLGRYDGSYLYHKDSRWGFSREFHSVGVFPVRNFTEALAMWLMI